MSDGNKFDVTVYSQAHPTHRLSLEEMGNVLLDAMQGTLICLDNHHTIVDVSKTVKNYFGFEQNEIIGLSMLLLIDDSERDGFSKFLNSPIQPFDICSVRMMTSTPTEYRKVKVHRKQKLNSENVDVHSTTITKPVGSIRTILVLTLDDSAYIDINLFDINKQEFYTKMNLTGEIIFEDHRGALITGYLPQELISQSIFNFVYHEDRLVKLHALWKCVTTSASKLQWRFNARNGSTVFLSTEYKLISNHMNCETIVARNEVLSPSQQSQFDELQSAWRHQCAADIKGNSSSFKIIQSNEIDSLASAPNGECRISVPALNMCFSTNKLQSLNITGNIFDGTKLVRPLTIQDYIQILIDHDKHLDNELINLINSITALASRQKPINNNTNNGSDPVNNDKTSFDPSVNKKNESDSIVRGILGNSMKYNHEKSTSSSESSPTLAQLINGNSNSMPPEQMRVATTIPPTQSKSNAIPLSVDSIQQQHHDFMKKYKAAKLKLESQLELARSQEIMNGGQASDVMKRNTILNKLSQLETIKNKHFARTLELKRQAMNNGNSQNGEAKDLLTSLLNISSPKSNSMDPNGTNNHLSSGLYNSSMSSSPPFYPSHQQRTSSPVFHSSSLPFENPPMMSNVESQARVKSSVFDEYLNSPTNYMPVQNPSLSVHSYMNVSYRENPMPPSSYHPSTAQLSHHPLPHPHHHQAPPPQQQQRPPYPY